LRLPFFRQPSSCKKFIFLQGEFSSIVTKCPSHLILYTFITVTIFYLYTNRIVHHCI
jgi:hypothetical protein